jgi:hypothetical protein
LTIVIVYCKQTSKKLRYGFSGLGRVIIDLPMKILFASLSINRYSSPKIADFSSPYCRQK